MPFSSSNVPFIVQHFILMQRILRGDTSSKVPIKLMNQVDEPNGYPSGQDGAILAARDYPTCTARKSSPKAK